MSTCVAADSFIFMIHQFGNFLLNLIKYLISYLLNLLFEHAILILDFFQTTLNVFFAKFIQADLNVLTNDVHQTTKSLGDIVSQLCCTQRVCASCFAKQLDFKLAIISLGIKWTSCWRQFTTEKLIRGRFLNDIFYIATKRFKPQLRAVWRLCIYRIA